MVRCPITCVDPLSTTNVYKLHRNAEDELRELGWFSEHAERKGWNVHQLMGSCITASVELACKDKGVRFMPRHELMSKNSKALTLPLTNSTRQFLAPDELFGLEVAGQYHFFVCEWDRKSEPWKRTKKVRVSISSAN